MPDLKNINLVRAKWTTVDLWGTPLKVRYLPQSLTPRLLRELQAVSLQEGATPGMDDAESGVEALLSAFLSLIVEWDLTADGEPVPLTRDGLEEIDLEILSKILKQVREAQAPNVPTGTPTNEPSSEVVAE